MKYSKFIYLTVVALAFAACTSEESTLYQNEETPIVCSEPTIFTIDTISSTADLARKIALEYPKQTTTRSTADKEIKEVVTINDDNGQPSMYVINYMDDAGFIITSATQDYTPVLAYADNGNFDISKITDHPIEVWLDQEITNITEVQKAPENIKNAYRSQWLPYVLTAMPLSQAISTKGSYDEVRDFILKNSQEWVAQGYRPIALGAFRGQYSSYYFTESTLNSMIREAESQGTYAYGGIDATSFVLLKDADMVTNVDPLTTSLWNQQTGFNTYIPHNYPVGCVGVAVGQIMKYWQYPASFNWSQITNYASDGTASFLHQVAVACKTIFKEDGSPAYNDDAAAALRGYGYSSAKVIDHNLGSVRSNITAHRPVYMSGNRLKTDGGYVGHAWVCDGLKYTVSGYDVVLKVLQSKTSFFTSNYGKVYNEAYPSTYIHMNWGYSGNNNGFFNDNNIKFNDRDYKYYRQDIINIYH